MGVIDEYNKRKRLYGDGVIERHREREALKKAVSVLGTGAEKAGETYSVPQTTSTTDISKAILRNDPVLMQEAAYGSQNKTGVDFSSPDTVQKALGLIDDKIDVNSFTNGFVPVNGGALIRTNPDASIIEKPQYKEVSLPGKLDLIYEQLAANYKPDDPTADWGPLTQRDKNKAMLDKDRAKKLQEIRDNSGGTWFSSGGFNPDYPVESIVRGIGGTALDLVGNLGSGIIELGEGVVDAGALIAAGGADIFTLGKAHEGFGKDAIAFAKKDLWDANKPSRGVDDISFLGEKSDALAQSGGQLLATYGLGTVDVPWAVTTGVSAFGSGAEGALNEGASYGEAVLFGLANAATEILTEKLFKGSGLGEKGLIDTSWVTRNISDPLVRMLADYGVDMLSEGSEEFVAEVANRLASKLYKEEDLAILLASPEALEAYMDSFIGGMVLSGGMNAMQNTVSNASTSKLYNGKLDKNQSKDNVTATQKELHQALVSEALEINPEDTFAQDMQAKLDGGKVLSGTELNLLIEGNEQALRAQDVAKMKAAAEARLAQLGESGDIGRLADVIVKIRSGENITFSEASLLTKSKYGRRVSTELNPKSIESGMYTSRWAENIGTERINSDAYNKGLYELAEDVAGVDKRAPTVVQVPAQHEKMVSAVENPIKKEIAAEGEFEGAEKGTKAVSAVDATVSPTLANASKKYGTQSQAMIQAYDNRQDVSKYDRAFSSAYNMGRSGIPFSYVLDSAEAEYLSPRQKEAAYKSGLLASYAAAQEQSDKIKNAANGKTGHRKGTVKGENVTVNDLKKTFNDTQNRAYKILSVFAEATGIDIVLYKSEANAKGDFEGAQGRFNWSDDKLYIDINAGLKNVKSVDNLGKYVMLRTFSHEFTHFIEKYNSVWYNEFRKAVFAELTARGENVRDLIETKMSLNKGMTYEKASREVVAEAMTDILPDSHFVETLATNHKNIFDKLLTKLKEFLADIKAYFNSIGNNPSREANALKVLVGDAVHYVESIVELFDKVALGAVENYQKTVAVDEVTENSATEPQAINNTDGGINNVEQRAEENERAERAHRGRASEVQGLQRGTRTQAENRSQVQGTVGETSKDVGILQRHHTVTNSTEDYSWLFDSVNYVEPAQGSALQKAKSTLTDEYGIECHVVKAYVWTRATMATTYQAKVYISEGIDEGNARHVAPHEATHFLRQCGFKPFIDFIDRTYDMLNTKSKEFEKLIKIVEDHLGYDILSMDEQQSIRFYEELNAIVYGLTVSGIIYEADVGLEWMTKAFNDFDAYINELSSIHEQYKKEYASNKEEQPNVENVDNRSTVRQSDADRQGDSRVLDEVETSDVQGNVQGGNTLGDVVERGQEAGRYDVQDGSRTGTRSRPSVGDSQSGDIRRDVELTPESGSGYTVTDDVINVVYSSKGAKAVDAVPSNKYDGTQKHVALVGLQIGRKVVFAKTVNKHGAEVDGFLGSDGVIYINPKNPTPMAFVFKHELAHFCERAGQKYRDFVNTVRFSETFKNWLRGKGFNNELEYNAYIRRTRAEIGETLDESGATREIIANFVGEMMFGDNTHIAKELISELEPKPRKTVVDYIRDFISWLKRKLHGNSSKARNEIRTLESKFASAYQAALKGKTNNSESFSISQNLESDLDKLLKGDFDASRNEIYIGETSNFMTDVIGVQALSLYMPASKAYSALLTEEEYNKKPYYTKQDNYHGIGKTDFMEILEKSETPIAAFAASVDEKGNKRQNRIVLVTDKFIRDTQNGKDGYAVVVEEVDSTGLIAGKRINANKAITVYPRLQLINDIQDAIINGRLLDITKKGEHLFAGVRGSNPQAAIRKDVLKENIAHFWANVKWESEKNKNFSSTVTPTLTPIQAALMKAGYIDRDGHIKDMRESDDLLPKGEGEQFSYTPVDPAEWLERYENGEISREEYLDGMRKKQFENPATIASLKPEHMKTTPNLTKKRGEAKGESESRFYGSLQKSSIFDEKFKEEVQNDNFIKHYSTITNKDTLAEAARLLDEGGEAYVERWKSKRTVEMSTVDTVVGFILMKRYQEVGNYEGATAVAQKIRDVGTLSGQRVQAFSIIGRYDADMMQAYAERELEEAWEQAVIGKSEKWVDAHKAQFKLTDEECAFIRDNILYATKLPEGSREKTVALSEITTLLQNKLPPVKGQSFKAWQRISMLFNPKTQIRNIFGNAVMVPAFVASDWFSAPLDIFLSQRTGIRTTGFTGVRGTGANLKAMGRGLFESYDDWKRHINTRQHDLNRFEIGRGKSFDETKWGRMAKMMNSIDRFTSFLLDAGDRTFYEMWFTNSLNAQMRINKVSEPTEAMVQIAIDEALERTWQDDNAMTKMVGKIKRAGNLINLKNAGQLTKPKESRELVESGYGLGDVLIKFTKTPANLTKAIYEFSPAAIATLAPQAFTLTKAIKNGTVTPAMQKRFVSNFGKAAAGTMLYVIFAALYNAGRITGKSDEDDDVAAFEKYIQGIPEYSVKIGNKWFSYDWAQPIGAVPAIVADFMESRKEGDRAVEGIIGAFKAGGEVLFNQSFMTSLQTLFAADSFSEGFIDIILGEVTVPIPTLFSQVANVFDDKRRVTYDGTSEWRSALNRAMSKFPGLRNTLVPEVDVFGREVANSQQDLFNAFFNPANVYTDTSSEVSDHVYDIYKRTGDAGAIPAKAPYSVDLRGEKKKLNDFERAEYQRTMGATANEMVEALLENDVYLAMNDELKLAVLKEVYSYSSEVAKSELDWHNSYEVIHGISEHITKSDFEAMSEEERIKSVENYLFSDYNGIHYIETDEGKANYFVNNKTPGAVLSATLNGDIDTAKEMLDGIDERVVSYGWGKADTEAEVSERKSTVKRNLTAYWKAAYIYAYNKKNKAEMEKIRKILTEIGLYGNNTDVKKLLRGWIDAYEKGNE